MRIELLGGIYADETGEFRSSYPRNLIPVPKDTGISKGYLRPSDGLVQFATGPGVDRGGINWNGECYRVMGTKLVRIDAISNVYVLGDVGEGGQVTMDYSFDRLAIASGGRLYYWTGSNLTQVTDPDLGVVVDFVWIDGYFFLTDGANLITTELNDPTQVNALKYGSSELDPDPVKATLKLRNEAYALNRYTIEVFDNIGGDLFPFRRIDGAEVPRGAIGTHMACLYDETIAFVGSARNEPPAVYLLSNGSAGKISTREIDKSLMRYTETVLATQCLLEARVDKANNLLMLHLPDRTWVYDIAASKEIGKQVWFWLDSNGQYRGRDFVWCYDRWLCGDPLSSNIGTTDGSIATHYGSKTPWEFASNVLYNETRGAIVNALELVALPGRVALGVDPTIWTSYSLDGETWSQERGLAAGKQGERNKRLQWRGQGSMRNYRMQKFRGDSDCHMSFAAIEATVEALA